MALRDKTTVPHGISRFCLFPGGSLSPRVSSHDSSCAQKPRPLICHFSKLLGDERTTTPTMPSRGGLLVRVPPFSWPCGGRLQLPECSASSLKCYCPFHGAGRSSSGQQCQVRCFLCPSPGQRRGGDLTLGRRAREGAQETLSVLPASPRATLRLLHPRPPELLLKTDRPRQGGGFAAPPPPSPAPGPW